MRAFEMHNSMGYVIATICPLTITPPISLMVFRQSERLRVTLLKLNRVMQQLEDTNAQLLEKASRDSMTGLLNREAFFTHVDMMRETTPGSLLIIDADHFKKINDVHGHYNGDGALTAIAHCISRCISDIDSIGRIGGEEFAIFLASDQENEVRAIAEAIREEVTCIEFRTPENELVPLSVSIGGIIDISESTIADHFQTADRRLYEAKRNGRNCVVIQPALRNAA
ncbi:GGDEF domain-containing protein [Phyllobacterium sp. 628]|uniref:GGDEF domain-containing protein n=1 Tax=Phyllobacterium sp. 628 TaxID=2718938 RepID=UPI0016628326|nr:GGDEF domain-containing protein [Phyllobacterium sp. 628]QND51711.1 GGDEF domain-containing protein [Phyllobacterium sp. 628]